MKDDLQPAKVLVTGDNTGLHKQDSVMSVLTVCQKQLESELLLLKKEMHLSAEDHGKALGTTKVRRPVSGGMGTASVEPVVSSVLSGIFAEVTHTT